MDALTPLGAGLICGGIGLLVGFVLMALFVAASDNERRYEADERALLSKPKDWRD